MANTHDLFNAYNKSIRLSDTNRERLLKARESLRDRMKAAYSLFPLEERKTHDIEFQSQGSFVMDTIIKPHSADFDLDDGVYFHGNLDESQRAETQEFHDLIIRAIDRNKEIEDIIDKPTCVRVKYHKGESEVGYHIDLPIYYAEHFETPELAHTKEGWMESSPVEFVAWFEEKTGSGFNKAFLYETRKYQTQFETGVTEFVAEEFATAQEAEARARELGGSGFHSHITATGETVYMPFTTHAQYETALEALDPGSDYEEANNLREQMRDRIRNRLEGLLYGITSNDGY